MQTYETLKHTTWECKYHIVFIPKCRREVLYGHIRRELGRVIRELAGQKECQVEEGHLMADHVHMMISIPPKYSVAQVMGYIKGKTAIIITHDLAIVQEADLIVVLEDGRVIQQGNHRQLTEVAGRYHELLRAQSRDLLVHQP